MDEMIIFHYPISPWIAVQLIVAHKYSNMAKIQSNVCVILDQKLVGIVEKCNQKLADNCVNEIYSNDANYLSELLSRTSQL